MDEFNLNDSIRSKTFMMESFLLTASLSPNQHPETVLRHKVTSTFLMSLMLELTLKCFYEIEYDKRAPFTHDCSMLFEQLSVDTQAWLVTEFDDARERTREKFSAVPDDIVFHELEEVLSSNAGIVRDFKYDAQGSRTNSSADGKFFEDVISEIKRRVA